MALGTIASIPLGSRAVRFWGYHRSSCMAKKKPVRKQSKPPVEPEGLQTGAYGFEELRQICRTVAKQEVVIRVTVPRSMPNELVPILSPQALRYIEFEVAADARFPKRETFVLEVGKRKFAWKP